MDGQYTATLLPDMLATLIVRDLQAKEVQVLDMKRPPFDSLPNLWSILRLRGR